MTSLAPCTRPSDRVVIHTLSPRQTATGTCLLEQVQKARHLARVPSQAICLALLPQDALSVSPATCRGPSTCPNPHHLARTLSHFKAISSPHSQTHQEQRAQLKQMKTYCMCTTVHGTSTYVLHLHLQYPAGNTASPALEEAGVQGNETTFPKSCCWSGRC